MKEKITEAVREVGEIPCLLRRLLVFVCGLFIVALGVAFSIKSDLGTTPISSVPYAVSLFTPLTVGTATIVLHCVLIVIQMLILKSDYKLYQLLQLPVAFMFGYMTDFANFLLEPLTYSSYAGQLLYCVIGIVIGAIGISIEVAAGIVTLAGEGTVLAICQAKAAKFGNVKVAFDSTLVVIACVLSICFIGALKGFREGTVASAICIGLLTKKFDVPLRKFSEKFLVPTGRV